MKRFTTLLAISFFACSASCAEPPVVYDEGAYIDNHAAVYSKMRKKYDFNKIKVKTAEIRDLLASYLYPKEKSFLVDEILKGDHPKIAELSSFQTRFYTEMSSYVAKHFDFAGEFALLSDAVINGNEDVNDFGVFDLTENSVLAKAACAVVVAHEIAKKHCMPTLQAFMVDVKKMVDNEWAVNKEVFKYEPAKSSMLKKLLIGSGIAAAVAGLGALGYWKFTDEDKRLDHWDSVKTHAGNAKDYVTAIPGKVKNFLKFKKEDEKKDEKKD